MYVLYMETQSIKSSLNLPKDETVFNFFFGYYASLCLVHSNCNWRSYRHDFWLKSGSSFIWKIGETCLLMPIWNGRKQSFRLSSFWGWLHRRGEGRWWEGAFHCKKEQRRRLGGTMTWVLCELIRSGVRDFGYISEMEQVGEHLPIKSNKDKEIQYKYKGKENYAIGCHLPRLYMKVRCNNPFMKVRGVKLWWEKDMLIA